MHDERATCKVFTQHCFTFWMCWWFEKIKNQTQLSNNYLPSNLPPPPSPPPPPPPSPCPPIPVPPWNLSLLRGHDMWPPCFRDISSLILWGNRYRVLEFWQHWQFLSGLPEQSVLLLSRLQGLDKWLERTRNGGNSNNNNDDLLEWQGQTMSMQCSIGSLFLGCPGDSSLSQVLDGEAHHAGGRGCGGAWNDQWMEDVLLWAGFNSLWGGLGEAQPKKIGKVMDMALRMGAPLIGLNDLGGELWSLLPFIHSWIHAAECRPNGWRIAKNQMPAAYKLLYYDVLTMAMGETLTNHLKEPKKIEATNFRA